MTRFAFPELKLTRRYLAAVIFTSIAASTSIGFAAERINICSHRQQDLIQPFLDAFTAKTGIDTNVVYSSKGLAQRLKAEGPASLADVILTVDIARLSEYADLDLLAPVESLILRANIPSRLRSEDNSWFGFSERARTLVTSKTRVAEGAVVDLEDLAKPEWKGRICSRAGSHDYKRALVASMTAAHGEAATETWAQAIRLIFANQSNRGNHMNMSGGGVAKYAKNKAAAIAFREFLTEEKAQHLYCKINFEYPFNPAVSVNGELASWGRFKPDSLPIERLAALAPKAQMIIDRVGW